MAKTKISEFSTTPGNNTDINGINIAEGCAPSGINNAIRELMSDLKEWQSGAMDVYVIPQGTAAAPGIQLYGDLDTGLYGYAANQLGVAVGGASAGYFSSAGWVGNVNGTITGDINATTIDTTNLEVTNIKAKDGTAAIWIANSTGAIAVSTLLDVDNLRLDGNTLSSTDTDGNIILAPNGTGDVYLDADTIRVGDSNTNVTITSNGTADLILNTNSGTNSGSITIQDGVNGNILIATNGTGQIQLTGDLDVANIETGAIKARDGTASATIADSTGVMTIASSVLTTTDINGGTIDNTVIGGATTAAGSFTTVTATQLDVDNLRFDANTISSTNTNGNIQIAPAGTGDVYLDADTVRIGDLNSDATLTTNGTADLILNTNSGSLSGSITIQDGVNGNILISPNGTGQIQLSGALDVTNIEVTNIKAKDGTAALSIADSTGVVSVSANPVLSGGTANGVVYLDASKVATSGSALTFDGSKLTSQLFQASSGAPGFSTSNQSTNAARAEFVNTGGTLYVGLDNSAGGLGGAYTANFWHSGNYALVFGTNNVEQMRLTSGGQLNLGGNFTSTNNTLQVTGNAAIGYTTAAPTTGLIVAGNVGIGTDSPGASTKLNVAGRGLFTGGAADPSDSTSSGVAINYDGTTGFVGAIQTGVAVKPLRVYGSSIVLALSPTATPSVTLDSSGNLGLGQAPKAWSAYTAAQVQAAALASTSGNNTVVTSNVYYDGSWKYLSASSDEACYYQLVNGGHSWHVTSTAGTAGNLASLNQAMTLDASGNFYVGTTSQFGGSNISFNQPANADMKIAANASTGTRAAYQVFINTTVSTVGTENSTGGSLAVGTAAYATVLANNGAYPICFATSNTERARITSGGYFKASNDGAYYGSTGSYHELRSTTTDELTVVVSNTSANPYGIYQLWSGASPDNNTNYFLRCDDSTTARCYIYSDGDLANHDGVYGTISDQKLKQDIVDAGSQWDDIKAIRFRKYRMKSDVAANPDAPALLGVIAQELEQVSPGLVDEHPDMETVEVTDEDGNVTQTQQPTGTTTKTVKSSILLMKAAVALQEAMARIEKLEAEVAALKGV